MIRKLLYFHNDHPTLFRFIGTALAVALYLFMLPFLIGAGLYVATRGSESEEYLHRIGETRRAPEPTWRDRLGTFLLILASPFILVYTFEAFVADVYGEVDFRDIEALGIPVVRLRGPKN